MTNHKIVGILFAVGVLFAQHAARAVEIPSPPLIHVSGDAAIQVPADEVTLTIKVAMTTNDKARFSELAERNAARIQEATKLFGSYQIAASDIKFVDYRFDEGREYIDEQKVITKPVFTVTQILSGKLRNLLKLPAIILNLLSKQYDIVNIEFCNSQLAKYKDQARIMAVESAKAKATLLAKTLGQTIGKAHSLTEKEAGWFFGGYRNSSGRGDYGAATPTTTVTPSAEANMVGNNTASIGLITINAEVTAEFELL